MFANVYGETTRGIEGVKINVEVDVSNGLPAFDIVGLPTMSVREARERVKSALRNSDYPFPMTHITVNLALGSSLNQVTIFSLSPSLAGYL